MLGLVCSYKSYFKEDISVIGLIELIKAISLVKNIKSVFQLLII